jgi:hypothetical protein
MMLNKTQKSTKTVQRVSPAQARRWYEEMERGTPATKIATRDDYDPRTVRKHVHRVRRAGGTSSAREEVLRDALRGHQNDLTGLANLLALHFRKGLGPSPINSPDGLPAWALADHLRKTPAGRTLRRWLELAEEYRSLRNRLVERTERDPMVVALVAKGVSDSALPHQVVGLAEGKSLDSLAKVASGGAEAAGLNAEKDVILGASQRWHDFTNAKNCCDEARNLGRQLVDRMDELRLRRYITGSCRYCPDAEGD